MFHQNIQTQCLKTRTQLEGVNFRPQVFDAETHQFKDAVTFNQYLCTKMLHLHLFFCQYRGNFRTSTQYFRPNFCTSTHAAAPSVVYLYVAKKLLQREHKRCIFTEYCPVIYTLFNLPILFIVQAKFLRNVNNKE